MKVFLLWFLLTPPVPGHLCTPSDIDFHEYRYEEQIAYCRRNVTTIRKIDICKRDGISDRKYFTVDHIIPLSLGGSNDDSNLWCQHESLNLTGLEFRMYRAMLNGEISQKDAVKKVLKAKFTRTLIIR